MARLPHPDPIDNEKTNQNTSKVLAKIPSLNHEYARKDSLVFVHFQVGIAFSSPTKVQILI
jgi:hypothetical protein